MKHRPGKQASPPKPSCLLGSLVVAIGLLGPLQASGQSAATNRRDEARWRGEAVFQFAARADYASEQGGVGRRDAFVGTAHLRFASPARPIVAGIMVEYGLIDEYANTLLVAGTFSYELSKWTAAAGPFYKRAVRGVGEWQYWCGARRHIADRHAIGVELFGSLDTGRPAKWMLGYYGTITETLSFDVAAGSGIAAGPHWVARTSVTWRPRLNRR